MFGNPLIKAITYHFKKFKHILEQTIPINFLKKLKKPRFNMTIFMHLKPKGEFLLIG
jgi:hypothetical protein